MMPFHEMYFSKILSWNNPTQWGTSEKIYFMMCVFSLILPPDFGIKITRMTDSIE